jgi:hypothetical protein
VSSGPSDSVHGAPGPRRLPIGEIALLAGAIAATAAWLVLNNWYSISGHWDINAYSFANLRGGEGERALSRPLIWTEVIFLGLGLAYALGWVMIARMPHIGWVGMAGIVLAGLGPGAVNVSLFPIGALDVFRYMRALKQFLYFHENPYTVGFRAHEGDSFNAHGFLLSLPNAKGPAWLLLSSLPAELARFDDPIRMLVALKVYNLLLIGITAWLTSQFFVQPAHRWLAAYAVWANPLVLFEGVGNVHNDVMIALFVVAALLALRGRSWLALPLLTISALVKYFTLQLGPLFLVVMIAQRWRLRTVMVSIAVSLLVAAICIVPFWSGGEMLEGIEDVGAAYNRSSHVSIISLARQYRIQGMSQADSRGVSAYREWFAVTCALLSLPILWRSRHGRYVTQAAIDLMLIFLLLLSLLYPWYLIAIIPLLAIRRTPFETAYLFVGTTLGLAYYPAFVWAWYGSGYARFERHLFLAMFLTLAILAYFIARFVDAIWIRQTSAANVTSLPKPAVVSAKMEP